MVRARWHDLEPTSSRSRWKKGSLPTRPSCEHLASGLKQVLPQPRRVVPRTAWFVPSPEM